MRRFLRFVSLAAILLSLCGAAPQAGQIRRIYNLTLTDANTEYSQALTGYVSQVTLQCRTAVDVQMAVTSGQSNTTFWTVKSGDAYYEITIGASDVTLYFRSGTAGVVVEIIAWSEN